MTGYKTFSWQTLYHYKEIRKVSSEGNPNGDDEATKANDGFWQWQMMCDQEDTRGTQIEEVEMLEEALNLLEVMDLLKDKDFDLSTATEGNS